jgi:2-C-methyl-D-erythritol 4-phosphate cytidylyltransferase
MQKYSFLLLSGGVGSRTALKYPKQFHFINGHPMVAYAIIAATRVPEIDEIIINCPEGFDEQTREIVDAYAGQFKVKIVPSGSTRHESTRLLYEAAKNDRVILHEAARPIITPENITGLINSEHDNVAYCLPIHFSMCTVDPTSRQMLSRVDRNSTMNIQLPQKFLKANLADAHQKAKAQDLVFTEDAMLCHEVGGYEVFYLDGWNTNVKITTPDDFHFAEAVLNGYNLND